MRVNPINFAVALGIAALLAYGFWSIESALRNFIAVGSFVYLSGTLLPAMGIVFELPRRTVNLRLVCMLFFVLGLVINGAFAAIDFSSVAYVIVSAVTFLLFIFIANAIYAARQ